MGEFEWRIKHNKEKQVIDLKSFMDERSLAREAVHLNIKLMKWRLLPILNIPKIQQAKCLLFRAGTLGCQLARNLIGWGIKNISFIDYSKVSYSNPMRQTLYEYEDTIKGEIQRPRLRLKNWERYILRSMLRVILFRFQCLVVTWPQSSRSRRHLKT